MSGTLSEDCIILLGAGASADAEIPISVGLNRAIRERLRREYDENAWERQLFNYLIGTIYYHRGLNNRNPDEFLVNVEEVISALRKLKERDTEFVSAFVGSWNEKLRHFSRDLLENVEKELILWVAEKLDQRNPAKVKYLDWFGKLQEKHGSSPLHIFTLNHDRALEFALDEGEYDYCTGFLYPTDGDHSQGTWNPELFEDRDNLINIYKLHGSLGWSKDDSTRQILDQKYYNVSDPHLMIFGILEKVTIEEPFFELIKRFKERARRARLIVTIGYGFADEHINSVLIESMRVDVNKRLLIVDLHPNERVESLEKRHGKELNMKLVETLGKGFKTKPLFQTSELDDKIEVLLEELSAAPF